MPIRSLLGESEARTSTDEIAWAFRKLLEEQAPLVVVFDDIQWGDETFRDLVCFRCTSPVRGEPASPFDRAALFVPRG